jgi:hypothetical protein
MDDDDKFWKIPEGRSWAEAGPILRSLKSGKGAAQPKPRRRSRKAVTPAKVNWTAQERADQFAKMAAFYRRIGQDYEASEYERRAAAILATIDTAQVRHG